jgi:hypothetical protein
MNCDAQSYCAMSIFSRAKKEPPNNNVKRGSKTKELKTNAHVRTHTVFSFELKGGPNKG